jgi:hypothetical protein
MSIHINGHTYVVRTEAELLDLLQLLKSGR